jgi:penicillin G amidase
MPKRHWSGLLPVPGTGAFEWAGFRDVDELPKAFNPSRGFIATANHDIRPEGYAIPLNYEFATPFRAQRITEVLDTGRHFTVGDFQRLQHDELSVQARTLVPRLLAAARSAQHDTAWEYGQLASWDLVMRADATAPLLFELWKDALSAAIVRRIVSSPEARRLVDEGYWLDSWPSPDSALARVPATSLDTLMVIAMDSALVDAANRLGSNRAAWRWGAVHTASFDHHVTAAFDPAPTPRGGDGETVNSTSGANLRQQYGASFREILDFANWDNSVATSVPGQSGQPESEFYSNLLPLWGRGEYFPLVYSRDAVERATRYVLWLQPAPTRRSLAK